MDILPVVSTFAGRDCDPPYACSSELVLVYCSCSAVLGAEGDVEMQECNWCLDCVYTLGELAQVGLVCEKEDEDG
ncbi:hypothetical protein SK128_016350 [Halocaridina rubra]|uniref:Uncharacterized protein n=1 Tax=Halocaridina rubra TaxID=373956 RepID=A0AAN8ZPS9_HALRR